MCENMLPEKLELERWVIVVQRRLKVKLSLLTLQQSTAPPQTFSMPVTVQASNQSTLQFSNPGNALVTTSYVTSSSLTDTHLLSPQQPALQRNTVSPGLPQRPASAGEQSDTLSVEWKIPAETDCKVSTRGMSDMKKNKQYFYTICSSSCLPPNDNTDVFVSILISCYSFIDLLWIVYVVPYHNM